MTINNAYKNTSCDEANMFIILFSFSLDQTICSLLPLLPLVASFQLLLVCEKESENLLHGWLKKYIMIIVEAKDLKKEDVVGHVSAWYWFHLVNQE